MTSIFPYLTESLNGAIPIRPFHEAAFAAQLPQREPIEREWIAAHQFTARPETSLLVPDASGKPAAVYAGIAAEPTLWSLAHLPAQLPAGTYRIDADIAPERLEGFALGVALAQYSFSRYRAIEAKRFVLALPDADAITRVRRRYEAIALARDLINTPTNDLGPTELAAAAQQVAAHMQAECRIIRGDALLTENYPAIHAVGRAASNPPHYIDIRWGKESDPKVTLVGKGVCFDTGGLDIKPYSSMKLMKKDMGGAALMLGLARLIADENLPIRLRVLIPAVENAISGNAYRPQDVIPTRKGLTIEIGSTDAEGRVILADALADAETEDPDLLIDAATLTGAARTALGTELPALFCNDDAAATTLQQLSMQLNDPLWRLPLWDNYDRYVKSPIADVPNSPNYGYAGAITAALFLRRFAGKARCWMHIDSMAWNVDAQPGRPIGGEALGLRALFAFIENRYSK